MAGAGAKLFVSGDVLTAAQVNTYLMDQSIMRFADATARDAAFGGSGEPVLAEGMFAYTNDTNTLWFYTGSAWEVATIKPSLVDAKGDLLAGTAADTVGRLAVGTNGQVLTANSSASTGLAWANAGGLTLITAQTIGSAVASVTVSNCFSATYDAYKIVISGGVGSDANNSFSMQLGGSTTGYYYNMIYTQYNNTLQADSGSNAVRWYNMGSIDTTALSLVLELNNPFLAKNTTFSTAVTRTGVAGASQGLHTVATSYTGFSLTPDIGTLTGGTIRVYGYALS